MKTPVLPVKDEIDALLSESWESIPGSLEQSLMDIPDQIQILETKQYDWLIFLLNCVLGLWFAGLILYFRKSLFAWAISISSEIVKAGLKIPELILHPLVIVGLIGCMVLGWFLLDVEKTSG